jgi:hypothetical protein
MSGWLSSPSFAHGCLGATPTVRLDACAIVCTHPHAHKRRYTAVGSPCDAQQKNRSLLHVATSFTHASSAEAEAEHGLLWQCADHPHKKCLDTKTADSEVAQIKHRVTKKYKLTLL